jgi:hypothetical protein
MIKETKNPGIRTNPTCDYCNEGFLTYILEMPDIGPDWYLATCNFCGTPVYLHATYREPTVGDMV